MTAYITTLGQALEKNAPIREELERLTQEYLNQGKKISHVDIRTNQVSDIRLSTHNLKLSENSRNQRKKLLPDLLVLLDQGKNFKEIKEALNISDKVLYKLIEEEELEHLVSHLRKQ